MSWTRYCCSLIASAWAAASAGKNWGRVKAGLVVAPSAPAASADAGFLGPQEGRSVSAAIAADLRRVEGIMEGSSGVDLRCDVGWTLPTARAFGTVTRDA